MARAGRKRKECYREANGQPQRPTMQQLNELNRRKAEQEKIVVLMQPHRNGVEDPMQECPLGRFLLVHFPRDPTAKRRGMGEVYFEAAQDYAKIVRSWQAASTVPRIVNPPSEGTGTGEGPSAATVASWWAKISKIESALIYRGKGDLLKTMKNLILFEREVPGVDPYALKLGLWIIASELGKVDPKHHPFR